MISGMLWVQESPFATWIRESSWAIFACLIVHTVSMGTLAGTAVIANLRRLGVASSLPQTLWPVLVPVMKWALAAVVFSGVLLLIAYPAKALLNPVFYGKFLIIVVALLLTRKVTGQVAEDELLRRQRFIAVTAVVLWCAAVLTGKLLEYTHSVLLLY